MKLFVFLTSLLFTLPSSASDWPLDKNLTMEVFYRMDEEEVRTCRMVCKRWNLQLKGTLQETFFLTVEKLAKHTPDTLMPIVKLVMVKKELIHFDLPSQLTRLKAYKGLRLYLVTDMELDLDTDEMKSWAELLKYFSGIGSASTELKKIGDDYAHGIPANCESFSVQRRITINQHDTLRMLEKINTAVNPKLHVLNLRHLHLSIPTDPEDISRYLQQSSCPHLKCLKTILEPFNGAEVKTESLARLIDFFPKIQQLGLDNNLANHRVILDCKNLTNFKQLRRLSLRNLFLENLNALLECDNLNQLRLIDYTKGETAAATEILCAKLWISTK